MSWQDEAACKGMGDLFFSRDGEQTKSKQERARVQTAKAICETCPVREECADAGARELRWGDVWGGEEQKRDRYVVRVVRHKVCELCAEPFFDRSRNNAGRYCSAPCRAQACAESSRRHYQRKVSS